MKKIILMLTLILGLAVSANAQTALVDNGTIKDNWYFGAEVGTTVWNDVTSWTLFNAKSNVNDGATNSWWRTQPLHVNVLAGKMLNPYFGGEVDFKGSFHVRGKSPVLDEHNLTINGVFNLTNIFNGYNGERRFFEIEGLLGAGWGHSYVAHTSDGVALNRNYMTVRGAVRGNFNVGKHWSIIVTPEYLFIPKNVGNVPTNKQIVNVSVGVKYRLSTKRGNFPMRKLYDYAEVESLKATIETLQQTNADLAHANDNLSEVVKVLVEKGDSVTVEVRNIGSILFEKNKSAVDSTAIAEVIKNVKVANGTIVLTGTTSPEGTEKLNKNLGLERATAVKQVLVNNGVDESRIVIKNNYENQRSVVVTVE